ncbi:HNH endonuclease [bacterium]|nr:HNH endonuclease [bacterium]|tara:strand:+ start:959 stop:1402 length:444 start_codon:yes stop_codon:yes gene_type:complete
MVNKKKPRTPCLECGKEPKRFGYKYCSNACQSQYQFKEYVARWKIGKEKGLLSSGVVSASIKRYLRIKFNNKCCMCGWQEVNKITTLVPLVADHIDGNWRNNAEENLRLLCPNCDSLTATYAALNKGNGRKDRVTSKRTKEARLLVK